MPLEVCQPKHTMRFGKTLQIATYAPWKANYIDYAKLKKLLRDDDSAPSSPSTSEQPGQDKWTDDDEGAFVDELVNVQLEKVHAFHKETYEKLRDRTAKCEQRLDDVAIAERGKDGGEDGEEQQEEVSGGGDAAVMVKPEAKTNGNGNGKKPVPSEQQRQKLLKETLAELDQITKETSELEKYSRINYTGFLKAAKKHDRKRGGSYRVRPLLQVRLAALPFNKEDYSPLLYRLSAMYSFVRQHLDGATETRGLSISEPAGANEGKAEYTSHKFWVHPENLLELKTMILRRLPVLVYNSLEMSKEPKSTQRDPSITSLYFDNPAFDLYTHKVEHGEASSLRLRWYGQLNAKPEIAVEKKLVREDNSNLESRFTLKPKYVNPFITNTDHMEKQIDKLAARTSADSSTVSNYKSSVSEIQTFITENDLQPVLRANYTRTAFQIPGDERVRISLDTDLAFIREDALDSGRPCRDPETWHRADIDDNELEYPFSSIRKGEISRFPFAILEIKLRNSSATGTPAKRPEWIKDIMSSHVVKEAPRFSKFVHGVALLFEDYVNTFPFWLSEVETDIRRDPQSAFDDEQSKKQKERDDESAVGSLLKSSSMMAKSHGKDVVSPVGSPSNKLGKSFKSLNNPSNLGASVASIQPTQVNDTADEADEDETGVRGSTTQGFKSLLPSFSTSKYAASRRSTALPPGVSKPTSWIKDAGPVRVEAKVWLANQRTFIKWQHVSVLLASLSLGLYNAAGEGNNVARVLAVVYTILAVTMGAWGYGIYIWRARMIEARSGRDFDAVTGPVIVCVGLIVALVLNLGFKVCILFV